MNLGVFTKLITRTNNVADKRLAPSIAPNEFPEDKVDQFHIARRILDAKKILQQRTLTKKIGWLYSPPNNIAIAAYQSLLKENPNHLGSVINKKHIGPSEALEKEVILKMANLYQAKCGSLDGYITTGSTEANIFSAWIGKKYVKRRVGKNRVCLLKTALTHYSIEKAADIIDISTFEVPLNIETWAMDTNGLAQKINMLYQRGYRGFLIPLTLGYTATGSSDDIVSVQQTLNIIQLELPEIKTFVWIDAALNGLIVPFLNDTFVPFSYPCVQTICVDFHKFGFVPYPAGLILYRKALRKLIEKDVGYIQEKDATILGSRQGASAASVWATIHSFGKSNYTKLSRSCLQRKRYFIRRLHAVDERLEIVSHQYSISCGVIAPLWLQSKLNAVSNIYGLHPTTLTLTFYPNIERHVTIYKFFFLPHIHKHTIDTLIDSLR